MNTADIADVLKGRVGPRLLFRGVLSSDQVKTFEIPRCREKDIAFVANILRMGDKRMGHWVVFLIKKSPEKTIYFLDSYGMKPRFYSKDFSEFVSRYQEYEVYSLSGKLQSDTSLICGLYASWYIYHCSRYTLSNVIRILRRNFTVGRGKENDATVFRFYLKKLNRKKCSYWRDIDQSLVTYNQCIAGL